MNKTIFEEGIEQGQFKMLRVVMEERFGTLSSNILLRLHELSEAELIQLGKAVVSVDSLADLGLDKD